MNSIKKIAFIGVGRMATAITEGLLKSGMDKKDIGAFDISPEASRHFEERTQVKVATSLKEAINSAVTIIIAVKPQQSKEVLTMVAPFLGNSLLISIVAGVKVEKLTEISNCKRVVRVMPNTPALIGEGISAYSTSKGVTKEDLTVIESILSSFGECYLVKEEYMDIITGLSGSGPAYVFDFIQGLADGAVNAGLPREQATTFAAKTVMGAAQMVIETGEHPSVLKDQVTSPAGTTARGLSVLEKNSFRGIVAEAVVSASERSKELGS